MRSLWIPRSLNLVVFLARLLYCTFLCACTRRLALRRLYPKCQWEEKTIRRLIGDGKLAARLRGTEEPRYHNEDRECPICFLHYSEINVTKCCHANICTECYLQVRPQKGIKSSPQQQQHNSPQQTSQNNPCPFCNAVKLSVTVAGKVVPESSQPPSSSSTEGGTEQAPESAPTTSDVPCSLSSSDDVKQAAVGETSEQNPPSTTPIPISNGFGSSLEKNDRVAMMRARSSSMASETNHSVGTNVSSGAAYSPSTKGGSMTSVVQQQIAQLAITPEERHSLEEEMKAQHHHPLTLRLEQEEAERRMRNELEYYQQRATAQGNNPSRGMRTIRDVRHGGSALGGSAAAAWPSGSPASRDWFTDRVPSSLSSSLASGPTRGQRRLAGGLEAALATMEEQSRRRLDPGGFLGSRSSSSGSGIMAMRGLSEEEQIALAIEASLRDSATAAAAANSTANAANAESPPSLG
jgi:hypothetical protein